MRVGLCQGAPELPVTLQAEFVFHHFLCPQVDEVNFGKVFITDVSKQRIMYLCFNCKVI